MRSSLIRNRYNSDWYACQASFRKKNCLGDSEILAYLEVLLQLDNILIFQLITDHDLLGSHIRSGGRIGKMGRLEHLQERPRNPNVIAEAHRGTKWSVYWRCCFCRPYQIPRRGVECASGYLPMHLSCNESNIVIMHRL
jgi:hypothetical protein